MNCHLEDWQWWQITAVNENEVVATATVYFITDSVRSPELCNLYVTESHQQIGIGGKILAFVRKSLDHVPRPLNLHCKVGSVAYQWYLRAGFVTVGEPVDGEIYMVDTKK